MYIYMYVNIYRQRYTYIYIYMYVCMYDAYVMYTYTAYFVALAQVNARSAQPQ